MTEDTDLRNDMLTKIQDLRRLNDTVADNCIRREIDEHLTRVFLLVRDGHTGNLNGGRGPWRPASEPPKQTEWVIASADGAVRCMAWNNAARRWEDWDGVGAIDPDLIDRWMSIPEEPTGQ